MFPRSSVAAPPAYLTRIDSPIGRIEITSDGNAITFLSIERRCGIERDGGIESDGIDRAGSLRFGELAEKSFPLLDLAAQQLGEYFRGTRHRFELPIAPRGTEFQESIWGELSGIQWGEVRSYGQLGIATGRATAGRAVGGAVGANPIPIIVPCHRVLARNNRITGYSAGDGIPTKLWLLEHEGIRATA